MPTDILRVLVQFKGKNYIKEAYQKMGWNALIAGDMSRYKFYMERVKLYGDDVIDDDKQVPLEAESGIPPNVTLLKARLLFDGGYYKTAIGQLEGLSPTPNPIKTRLNSPIVLAAPTMRVVNLKSQRVRRCYDQERWKAAILLCCLGCITVRPGSMNMKATKKRLHTITMPALICP